MKIQTSIVKVLAYFDMFRYPVSAGEVTRFLDQRAGMPEVEKALQQMVADEQVFCFDGFYALQPDPALADRRKKGNLRAQELMSTANRIAGFLYSFPFVRGVGISGSLSKQYADEDADIDFFIITSANRLWIARTLMHFFKKLTFLAGRQHWYCMNYYIDEEALLIAEKNIFTATEVVTLLPVHGVNAMPGFFSANAWTEAYFPNYESARACMDPANNRSWIKQLVEKLFDHSLGMRFDDLLMRITAKRWQAKEIKHSLNIKGEPMSLWAGKHFSRPNPGHFQKKILERYAEKLAGLETALDLHFERDAHFLRSEII